MKYTSLFLSILFFLLGSIFTMISIICALCKILNGTISILIVCVSFAMYMMASNEFDKFKHAGNKKMC